MEGQCVHILPGGMLEARLGCARLPAAMLGVFTLREQINKVSP